MSRKLIVMQRLTRLLENLPAYTYVQDDGTEKTVSYDLRGRVFRGRKSVPVEEMGDAALSIMEAPRANLGAPAGRDGQVRDYDWTLNIQGWPREDRMNPSDPAYEMAAAVEQRLARMYQVTPADSRTGFGGSPVYPLDYHLDMPEIHAVTVADSLVLPAQENLSAVAFFYIPITISFVKNAAR